MFPSVETRNLQFMAVDVGRLIGGILAQMSPDQFNTMVCISDGSSHLYL